jgi:DNA-binding transcriptional LysR family regulator
VHGFTFVACRIEDHINLLCEGWGNKRSYQDACDHIFFQFGSPRESGDLKNCDVIDWADERPDSPAIRWFTKATDIKRVIFRANSPSDRLTAAREGMGIALGPCLMAEADAGLVRLLPEIELVGPDVWLLVHRELADLARVRVVLDVLAQCARADVGRFAGRTKQVAGN